MLKAIQKELTAVDDRTFKLGAQEALSRRCCSRSARTRRRWRSSCRSASPRPTRSSRSTNTSAAGPMKFAKGEWVPGAKAVFEKFADYVPREEPASWLAGGKKMLVDRIEWVIMPDPATASAALQNGEVDWWENPISDLVPVLQEEPQRRGRHRRSARQHRHLPHEPPAPAVQRRAGAARGADGARARKTTCAPWSATTTACGSRCPAIFTPGTPLYTEEGGEILKGKRDIAARQEAARRERLHRPAGDLRGGAGPADHQGAGRRHRRPAEADRHERRFRRHRLGHRSASAARRSRRRGRAAGRMFHTWHAGADCINPAVYIAIRANGDRRLVRLAERPGRSRRR